MIIHYLVGIYRSERGRGTLFDSPGWSEEAVTILKEHWFQGMSDRQIGKLVNRSEKAVFAKRKSICLTTEHYPERGRTRTDGRIYTEQEDNDILARFNSGVSVKDLAASYDVSDRAMDMKIERLLEREFDGGRPPATKRLCLWCGDWFVSKLPKKVNRRCPTCQSIPMY